MKRILVSALLCTSLFAAAQAQTTHTVKLVDTQLQDVLNVLEDMDIYIPVSYTHLTLPTNREV